MNTNKTIRFTEKNSGDFYPVLRKRVKAYFRDRDIPMHANTALWIKSGIIIALYILSYGLMLSGLSASLGLFLLFAAANGLFTALIGFNISHDAVHSNFSRNKRINKWLGMSFCFMGFSDYVWKVKHNGIHHVFTNIPNHDPDIDQDPYIRVNPMQKLKWIHRFQHIYIFLLYPFTTLAWVFVSDFEMFFTYGLGKHYGAENFKKERRRLFFYKLLYYIVFLAVPLWVVNLPWYFVLLGFVVMHIVAGTIVAFVFQFAHVAEELSYPMPGASGTMETSWATHQLYTTANFACKNVFVGYLLGGTNFQIEHHLFPNISHVHLRNISPIVKQTAKEFGLPYIEKPSVMSALRSHIRKLKWFGSQASVLQPG